MQDRVESLVKNYDLTARFIDNAAIASLLTYLDSGRLRTQVIAVINANAPEIVREAARQLFEELPDLILPGGNAYTTRRHAMYLRDMDYFLRYSTYALLTGDNSVLDERLLAGLRDTFNSLGIPLGPTARSIQIMKNMAQEKVAAAGLNQANFVDEPFDYIIRELSEKDV